MDAVLDALHWLALEQHGGNVSVVREADQNVWVLHPGVAHRSFVVTQIPDIGMVIAAYDLACLRWFAYIAWETLAVAPDLGLVFLKCPAASGGAGPRVSRTKALQVAIPMNAALQERILQEGQCLIALTAAAQEGFSVTEEASLVPVVSHIYTPEFATNQEGIKA